MLLSRESQDILKGKDGDGNDVHVFRMPENERVQVGVDAVKDTRKRGILTDNFREAGVTLEKGLRSLFRTSPGQPHIIDCILMNEGIDPNRHFIDDLAPVQEIQTEGTKFWNKSAGTMAVKAASEHKFWQSFLNEANIFTGREKSGVRFNQGRFQEHLHEIAPPATRASDENTVDSITVDEPIITYYDRPPRDSERTMYKWGIQDIIAEIIPLMPGTLDYRQVISDVQFDDEAMNAQMELTEGALVSLKISKNPGELVTYKIGIQVSDEFRAGAIRMNMLFRTQARIGRFFNRACLIRMLNRIASNVLTGTTRYGTDYTVTSSETAFTGQHWGQVEDSYEVEEMNRVVGKKAAIRAIKEMNMGTENQTYAQYYQRPTQFYDLGDSMMDVGLGGLNSSQLAAAFTDKAFFTFDVMSTCVLYTAPWLEMDEDTRDAPTGSLLTSMRTAVDEHVEDNNSIRKASWA